MNQDSKTIIPSSAISRKPGKNSEFVSSRGGGPAENRQTKVASSKHQNPEYFKRQSDRKHADNMRSNENVGRGVGQIGTRNMKKKDNIPARKDIPIQRDFNKHQANVGKDQGRGTGQVGRDQAPFQMKQFSKGTMY